MTRQERIEKQEFLLAARPGNFEDLIICPRCDGWGYEDVDLPDDEPEPCKLCKGERVVKRRVTVVVEDSPVGKDWPNFQPAGSEFCCVCSKVIAPGTLAAQDEDGKVRHLSCERKKGGAC